MYIMTPGEPTAARAAASPTPSPRHGGRRAVADAAVVTAPPLSSAARPHPPLGIPASRRRCQPHVAAAAHLVAPLPPVSPRPPLSPPDPAAADVYADETGFTPFLPSWRWGYRSRRHPVGRRGRPTPGNVADASSRRRRSSVLPHSVSSWGLPHFAGRGWRCPLTWWSAPPEATVVPVLLRRFSSRRPPPSLSSRALTPSRRLFRLRCCWYLLSTSSSRTTLRGRPSSPNGGIFPSSPLLHSTRRQAPPPSVTPRRRRRPTPSASHHRRRRTFPVAVAAPPLLVRPPARVFKPLLPPVTAAVADPRPLPASTSPYRRRWRICPCSRAQHV